MLLLHQELIGQLNHLLFNKKILAIPPLLVDGNFVPDFNKKVNLFNNLFASICTPTKKTSTLPYSSYRTNSRINYFHVTDTEKDIKHLTQLRHTDVTIYQLE